MTAKAVAYYLLYLSPFISPNSLLVASNPVTQTWSATEITKDKEMYKQWVLQDLMDLNVEVLNAVICQGTAKKQTLEAIATVSLLCSCYILTSNQASSFSPS